jgi:CBS domain-containing protein
MESATNSNMKSEGKKLTAADIMTNHVVTSSPHESLAQVASAMLRHSIGSVAILEDKKIVGIITERDFVRIVEQVGVMLEKNMAKDHMTKPVVTVQSDTSVAEIINLMKNKHIRHLIVLDKERKIAGIISSRDLMKTGTGTPTL